MTRTADDNYANGTAHGKSAAKSYPAKPARGGQLATSAANKTQSQAKASSARSQAPTSGVRQQVHGTAAVSKSKGSLLFVGTYEGTARDFGFVTDGENRMFVHKSRAKGAMGGDLAEACITTPAIDGRAAEGEIVRIVERRVTTVIGSVQKIGRSLIVVPDSAAIGGNITLLGSAKGAVDGDKVVLTVTRYPQGRILAGGTVDRVLGPSDEFSPNYEAILLTHGIRTNYPPEAVTLAENMQNGEVTLDGGERRGLTNRVIFTIDGASAKDFDDAISIDVLPNGNFLLGVHIADVSHYVRPQSPIDIEAQLRGTSVYFVDKVVPMLPFALSDDLCSLRPNLPRFAMTCDMELTAAGERVGCDIYKSLINSKCRCIYEELNGLLDGDITHSEKYAAVMPSLKIMLPLFTALYDRRVQSGAMTFETVEPVVRLDGAGKPCEISMRTRGVTERLIEEFMLAANEAVAALLAQNEASCIYRVHDKPSTDRAADLIATLNVLGIDARPDGDGRLPPAEYRRIVNEIAGKPYEQIITRQLVRSMKRAAYSAENIGHYGLASKIYCHFTSPIRRYPDLLVHRALGYLQHSSKKQLSEMENAAAYEADLSTKCEDRAVAAERDIEDMYRCLYMTDFVGQQFYAVISSVVPFGVFVELENTVEGLIHISNLPDDYYEFDDVAKVLYGVRTGRRFSLGQEIKVCLAAVDFVSRRMDFVPV